MKIRLIGLLLYYLLNIGCSEDIQQTEDFLASRKQQSSPVLLEIFSLTSCVACYEGDKLAESMLESSSFDVVVLHHFGNPAVGNGEQHPTFIHDDYYNLVEQLSISSYPLGVLNRTDLSVKEPPGGENSFGLKRHSWGWGYNNVQSEYSPINIGLELHEQSQNNFVLDYELYCTQNISIGYTFHVAISQSNIKGFLKGQGNDYTYNHVCRSILTGSGISIDKAFLYEGNSTKGSLEVTLPEFFGNGPLPSGGGKPELSEMSIVGFILDPFGNVVSVMEVAFPY